MGYRKMKYTKPPLSIAQQVELLKSRGMQIPDPAQAEHYLYHLNYYRLSGYMLPFQIGVEHQFQEGTTFGQILNLYLFDRKLRLLLMDAIERIEVSVRTQWAYHLAHQYGSHAHLNPGLFQNQRKYEHSIQKLEKEYRRSHETFIKHYRQTYTKPEMPPLWVVCEIMSLGHLSSFYQNIKQPQDRERIAKEYGLDEKVLTSFLHHLSHVRNLCAHHSRIWNRCFTITLRLPKKKPANLQAFINRQAPRNVYNTLLMMRYMMAITCPGSKWESRLIELLKEHNEVEPSKMGFPNNWEKMSIWNDGHWHPGNN